jgi:transposase
MTNVVSGILNHRIVSARRFQMPPAKNLVQLTPEQRDTLTTLIRTGRAAAQTLARARILLKADCSPAGPALSDPAVAAAVEVSVPTVERVRRAFAKRGLEAALQRKPWNGPPRRKLDGAQEAQLTALACSPPPEGAARWTLALLADKLAELKVVESIARDTVRVALKKTNSSRG